MTDQEKIEKLERGNGSATRLGPSRRSDQPEDHHQQSEGG